MPVYEYDCAGCGPFAALRPMAEFQAPCDCPTCGASAPRVMLTAPALAAMDPGRRRAIATNERSANAPRLLSSRGHGAGCGCCSGKASRSAGEGTPKSFPNSRPWMISH